MLCRFVSNAVNIHCFFRPEALMFSRCPLLSTMTCLLTEKTTSTGNSANISATELQLYSVTSRVTVLQVGA